MFGTPNDDQVRQAHSTLQSLLKIAETLERGQDQPPAPKWPDHWITTNVRREIDELGSGLIVFQNNGFELGDRDIVEVTIWRPSEDVADFMPQTMVSADINTARDARRIILTPGEPESEIEEKIARTMIDKQSQILTKPDSTASVL